MIDISSLKRYDVVLTVNLNLHKQAQRWIPRIFLESDGDYLKFTDLEIPKEYIVIKEFDKDLAYERYIAEKIPVLPKENDIVYVSNCDYMFNPILNRDYWSVRKFVRTDDNKFVTIDNENNEQKWDYIIPYYDNIKDKVELERILSCENDHLSYATISYDYT